MPVPSTQEIRKPLLEVFKDEAPHSFVINNFLKLMADEFGEITTEMSSTEKTTFKNNINEAKAFLNRNGLLSRPSNTIYMITTTGLEVLEENPEVIDEIYLAGRNKLPDPEPIPLPPVTPVVEEPEPEPELIPEAEPIIEEPIQAPEPEAEPIEEVENVEEKEEIIEEAPEVYSEEVEEIQEEITEQPEDDREEIQEVQEFQEAPEDFVDEEFENAEEEIVEPEEVEEVIDETEPEPEEISEEVSEEIPEQQEQQEEIMEPFDDEFENAEEEFVEPEQQQEEIETFEEVEAPEAQPVPEPQPEPEGFNGYAEELMQSQTLEEVFKKYNSDLANEVLEKIAAIPSDRFEMLVIDLLSKMGYRAFQNARYTTEAEGSDLIHGVILENRAGMTPIYIQARKLSPSKTVGRSDMKDFIAAIQDKGGKGLFATTANFSEQAVIAATDERVMLIDGQRLASLMISNNFCVNVEKIFEVKSIDLDSFSEYEN